MALRGRGRSLSRIVTEFVVIVAGVLAALADSVGTLLEGAT